MRFLIQKVKNLKISDGQKLILDLSQEKFCLLIYVGVEKGDENKDLDELIQKIENLQILDENGKFKLSISEIKPQLIFVSQITLIANFEKGRINFNQNLDFNLAKKIFDDFVLRWQKLGYNVYKTEFGSYLEIENINLGPVNFYLNL